MCVKKGLLNAYVILRGIVRFNKDTWSFVKFDEVKS